MNINIQFNNNNYIIHTKKYQSIYSIINQIKEEYYIEYDINDLFLDYNGNYLNNNLSLEKYDIKDEYKLNLNVKLKGGSGFFSFLKKNPYIVFFSFLISLLPLIILPTGFMPTLSSLIENIIKKSLDSIGHYLVCVLGKKTLYNRMLWIVILIKYSIFFLMVFVVITLPLTLLCVTMKGHNVIDSPTSICSPVKIANYTGLILTVLFILFYGYFRLGDIILSFLINIFKKFYVTDTLINPILSSILSKYDMCKYVPIYFIPFIGEGFAAYFTFLDVSPIAFESVLSTVMQLGCKTEFSKKAFMNALSKKLDNKLKDANNKNNVTKNSPESPSENEGMCTPDVVKCCNPNNFINIGDSIKLFIENPIISIGLKTAKVYSILVLVSQGLYEYALNNLGIEGHLPTDPDERVSFLKNILLDKSNKLKSQSVALIKEYLTTFNPDIIPGIEQSVNTDLSNDLSKVDGIKESLSELNQLMIQYSQETGAQYIGNKSLCQTILKYLFLNSLCNVFQTSKSSLDVIQNMKDISNITDMMKAGSASGAVIALIYFIALIVLIVMGIFDKY
jgi:hypothetical protein